MLKSVQAYEKPFDPDTYIEEPSDRQANGIARALAHWFLFYMEHEPDRTAQSIVLDILECNGMSNYPMDRDECERIAAIFHVEI